ncbi:SCO2522 family protein [Catenulispora yoronensis]|uniref:SCO2522 family protein n=1 Tax=Catenulispora yoronensis TaxID=450799 RepID=A0ABN2V243_9ACTN
MSAVEVSYQEATETARIEAVPFSHLSVETGHLVLAQFADGDQALIEQLEQAGPWLEASVKRARKRFGRDARISTCFLVDDQTPWDQAQERPKPSEVFDLVASAGARVGFAVDYIACESGCATARDRPYAGPHDRSPLADIVAGAIVAEPEAGANGSRPPTGQSGWLSNGRRSPSVSVAMDAPQWEPPAEFGPYRHSVFVDVELWSTEHGSGPDAGRERQYSSSLLTAVWQLLRLGLVRNAGRAVATPYGFGPGEALPDLWSQLPSITRRTPDAAPFTAYLALSLLPARYRASEHAAEVVLDHLRFDEAVLVEAADRARGEAVPVRLPENPAGRISHLFFDDVHTLGPAHDTHDAHATRDV